MERVLFEVKRVIVGQERMVERMMVSMLARGHCLLEGVPGVAKTLAVETLAKTVGGTFARLQFTPDLVPSDIVGTRIYRPGREQFDTELGPVFANFVLADEINRAPAKVQSALLEVMAERQVSIGGIRHPVPLPFLVLATQNPIESEGVYPLPEAQRDRFLMKINVGYPSAAEEREIVYRMGVTPPVAVHRDQHRRPAPAAGQRRPGVRPPRHRRLRRPAGAGHPRAAPGRAERRRRLGLLRRQPAGQPRPDRRGPGHGPAARPRLRAAPGRARHRPGRAAPTGWCSPTTRSPTAFRPSTPCAGCCETVPLPQVAPRQRAGGPARHRQPRRAIPGQSLPGPVLPRAVAPGPAVPRRARARARPVRSAEPAAIRLSMAAGIDARSPCRPAGVGV